MAKSYQHFSDLRPQSDFDFGMMLVWSMQEDQEDPVLIAAKSHTVTGTYIVVMRVSSNINFGSILKDGKKGK